MTVLFFAWLIPCLAMLAALLWLAGFLSAVINRKHKRNQNPDRVQNSVGFD